MYKAIFLKRIQKMELQTQGIDLGKIVNEVDKKRWNVYAKAPF